MLKNLPNPFRKKKPSLKKEFSNLGKDIENIFSFWSVKVVAIFVLVLVVLPSIFFFFNRPQVQKDINYGVTFSNRYAMEMGMDWKASYIKMLDDLKVRNIRVSAYWDDIEREQDVYDYSDIVWQVEEAQKRNVNIMLAMGKKVPRWPECFEPLWWREITDYNTREHELLEYIEETTRRLQGYSAIKYWQVENEPFFPFGVCSEYREETLAKEVNLVRSLDSRPILIQDSGEGGFWFKSFRTGDYLGISMYRKIWYDFWGVFLGKFIYFQYPLAHWTYKIKAAVLGIPYERVIVTELQSEPWGPGPNHILSEEEKSKTMSPNDFLSTITYAQKAGFKDLYLWGVEWWLWEKEINNNPFYWNTAKGIFNTDKGAPLAR